MTITFSLLVVLAGCVFAGAFLLWLGAIMSDVLRRDNTRKDRHDRS